MARLTISLEKRLAEFAKRRARDQRRSTSSYLAMLIERDLTSAPPALDHAAAEARSLGLDPVAALRERIAALQVGGAAT